MDKPGAFIFMFGALRESLLAFDVFRFGTAISQYLLSNIRNDSSIPPTIAVCQ
jgi:hypothetical protein